MDQAEKIRASLAKVEAFRHAGRASPLLEASVVRVKNLQSLRFRGTYADLAKNEQFAPATNFFLDKLYGEHDFASRDAQFCKVAGALERVLPGPAISTAVTLASLHALSEELDYAMAATLVDFSVSPNNENLAAANYVHAWRQVGRPVDRRRQLQMVLTLGRDLVRLTTTRGLRIILRMMHSPAEAAGFGALQHFLECGFDAFASMSKKGGTAAQFLSTIENRESDLINMLFDEELSVCKSTLARVFEVTKVGPGAKTI